MRSPHITSLTQLKKPQTESQQPHHTDWASPQARRSLRKAVNTETNPTTRQILSDVTHKVINVTSRVQLLEQDNKRLIGALYNEKKQRTRGKKLIEEHRANEETGCLIFSPRSLHAGGRSSTPQSFSIDSTVPGLSEDLRTRNQAMSWDINFHCALLFSNLDMHGIN